ncbi:MAG TPA: hypothetical protein VNO55_11495 [Polyangia bacterium]|nr:hypothetical protein [Polyangia bacterium]
MRDPIDKMQPWTIKSMSTEARDMAVIAARREGLTVGQWLERVIREAASDQVANKSAPDVVRLAPLVASMPRWLRAALWRRVAGELGVQAPAGRPRKALQGPDAR